MADPLHDDAELSQWILRGQHGLAAGDVDAARTAHAELLTRAPDHRDTLLLSAMLAALDDDFSRSREVLETALDLYPDDIAIRLTGASLLLDVHMDPQAAVPLLEDILMTLAGAKSADPAKRQALELDVRLRLTEALSQAGDFEGALDAAQFALDRTGDVRARFALAQARYAYGDVESAGEELADVLREAGERADAWHLEGRVALSLGDEARAARAFERAAELDAEAYPVPPRLSPERFEARMRAAMRALPDPLSRYAAAMEVEFRAMPDLEALRAVEPPLPPSAPLFLEGARPEGDPLSRLPEKMLIFQRNVEVLAASDDELEEVLLSALTQAFTLFLGA